jgi:hypothetical protein
MPTDPRLIQLELTAIVGALTLANNTLKRVNDQKPPGPPTVPEQTNALRQIVDLSDQIGTLAKAILSDPAGTPGTPGA